MTPVVLSRMRSLRWKLEQLVRRIPSPFLISTNGDQTLILQSSVLASGMESLGQFPNIQKTGHGIDEAQIEDFVAANVQVNVPFNNPVTGVCALQSTHKAGIHAKAILANPSTYEIINPADFGMSRYVHFTSRLTGWNAIKSRVEQLGLTMNDEQVKSLTTKIKNMADVRILTMDDTDTIIRSFASEAAKAS
ncbi:MAG: hypothetical protein Q9212_003678 [Teloschistes hypoglaucus]